MLNEESLKLSSSTSITPLSEFGAGTISGVANVLVSHPLDTVKIRIQTLHKGVISTIKHMTTQEGLFSFYKGVKTPLYSYPFINAMSFGAFESSKRLLGIHDNNQVKLIQSSLAGAIGGLAACILTTPVELIKCRLQMEGVGIYAKGSETISLALQVIQKEGFLGLYKGNIITMLREAPGYASYFASYDIFKKILIEFTGNLELACLIAGGVAGSMSWVFSYPQDVIKSYLQLDQEKKFTSHHKYRDGGILHCSKEIYNKQGIQGFWRGFNVCAGRAFYSNALTFIVYEKSKALFMSYGTGKSAT